MLRHPDIAFQKNRTANQPGKLTGNKLPGSLLRTKTYRSCLQPSGQDRAIISRKTDRKQITRFVSCPGLTQAFQDTDRNSGMCMQKGGTSRGWWSPAELPVICSRLPVPGDIAGRVCPAKPGMETRSVPGRFPGAGRIPRSFPGFPSLFRFYDV